MLHGRSIQLYIFYTVALPKPLSFFSYSETPDDTQDPDHVLCYSELDCHGAELVVSLAQCCALANGGESYKYEDEPVCNNW